MKTQHRLLMATSIIALGLSAHALAQEAETDSSIRRLDQITVTAEKREQSLQDVPVSISVFTDETRQSLNLKTLSDFTNFTPSLTFSPQDDRVFLRGVGRQTNTNGSDPGVSIYADGIYDSSTSAVSKSDFFVERVEVLRGPQGTLYGRNSIGGAINVISKRPTDQLETEGRLYVGNYETSRAEASISGPLAKNINARLAGSVNRQGEGFFKNLAGGPSEGGAGDGHYYELQLDIQPTDTFSLWLKADSTETRLRRRTQNSVTPYDTATFLSGGIVPNPGYGFLQPGFVQLGSQQTNPALDDVWTFSADTQANSKTGDAYGLSGIATWSLPNFDVKYMAGYRTYSLDFRVDLDDTSVTSYDFPLDAADPLAGQVLTGGPNCQWLIENMGPVCGPATIYPSQKFILDEDKDFWSHELTLQSTTESNLWWVVGAYYYEENLKQINHYNNSEQPQLLQPINGPANPSGDFVDARSDITTQSYALYGQADFQLSDTLTLTGGLRYSHDEKSGSEGIRIIGFGGVDGFNVGASGSLTPALDFTSSVASASPAPGVVSALVIDPVSGRAERRLKNSWSAVSGTAGLQWQPSPYENYFVRYSRGYKSGGFNAGGVSQFPQTEEEILDAVEAGAKRTIADQLQLNATVYYYSYDGLQTPLTVSENGINITRFFNIEDTKAHGFELETIWSPTDDLRLMLSYAYNDSEIQKACCFNDVADPSATQPGAQPSGSLDLAGNQPQSLKGAKLPRTVPHKIGLNALYDIRLGDRGDLTLGGSYSWHDKTYHSVFNRPYNETPSFSQVDLTAVWKSPEDRFRVIGSVKNLFDVDGFDGASATLMQDPAGNIRQIYNYRNPRTFGIELQVKL